MQIGMLGLGRMGANMTRRLMRAGQSCVVYDVSPDAVQGLAAEGATGAASMENFIQKLEKPRAVLLMLPAGIVPRIIEQLTPLLEAGDTIIDGGNSYYRDDLHRAAELKPKGLHFVDVGTSGGIWGLERGFCLVIGGET